MKKNILILVFVSIWILASCQSISESEPKSKATAIPVLVSTASPMPQTSQQNPIPSEVPPLLPAFVPSNTPPPAAITRMGPEEYPSGYSPLSGLKVENPDTLTYPPIMVSVSNFPPSARPPAGLDWCPAVYEAYIGDGETRFLATFYGDYPKLGGMSVTDVQKNSSPYALVKNPVLSATPVVPVIQAQYPVDALGIGPIRSARIWYGQAASLNHAALAFAHAWPGVLSQLPQSYITINPRDDNDINSGFLDVTEIQSRAMNLPTRLQPADLAANLFDINPPETNAAGWENNSTILPVTLKPQTPPASSWIGKPADTVWVPWSNLSQIFWRYDANSGAYHRYQDLADATTFVQSIDRLNGKPLTYENLIILFANHTALYPNSDGKSYVFEIELLFVQKFPAILFRDGKMYNIFWTTASGDYEQTTGRARPIRYIDEAGNPFPLKPGQTWVTIMPPGVRFDVKEVPPFSFESKRAIRNLEVNFGDLAATGEETAVYQEDVFYLPEMASRYPVRHKNTQEGSGTWIVPFLEAYILQDN